MFKKVGDTQMEVVDLENRNLEPETNGILSKVRSEDISDTRIHKATENTPIGKSVNIPLNVLGQCYRNRSAEHVPARRYTKAKRIETLAVNKFKQNGLGISFNDLLSNSLAEHKPQAQGTLKHCLRAGILFTPYNHKPQRYYPTCLKSEILNKNIPVGPIGVGLFRTHLFQGSHKDNHFIDFNHDIDSAIVQSLEGYVLPLLPKAPLHIHKLHFKTRILPECYQEIVLPAGPWNKGKEHEELIGRALVRYRFYANGTVVVSTESSNNPLPLATEFDCSNFMAFLGQVRDRLILFLADKHERIVADIMSWELTQCDINKDVRIERWWQPIGLSIQVRHLSHLLRVYIKTKGEDTVCRVEESINSKCKSVTEVINDIFNPTERLEMKITELDRKIDRLFYGTCLPDNRILEHVRVETDSLSGRIEK